MNRTFFAFAMQHFSLIDLKTFRAVATKAISREELHECI